MRILLFILTIFMFSCGNDLPDKDKLIEDFYQKRLNEFNNQNKEVCEREILDQVKIEIDSLIDRYISAQLLDTVNFPNKPPKPVKPEHIIDQFHKFEIDSIN